MARMIFSVGGSSGLNWMDFVDVVKACEEMDFYAFYPSDHLMTVQVGRGTKDDRIDAIAVVLALAPITSKIRLGVQVIGNLFRHPVITAKMMNALDHISNGRADIGLGAGWSKMEHAAHGMAFPGLAERIERMEESITLMKALFTEERATFEGKYYQVYEVPFDPKPVQKPHPPIMIGGINDASLRVAARHANDWSSLGPRLEIQERALRLKEICEEEERDFSSIRASHQVPLLLTDDRAAVDAMVDIQVQRMVGNPGFKPSPHYGSLEEQMRDTIVAGDVEDVKEQLDAWREVGVSHMNFVTPRPFNRDMLERFQAEVAPAFA